MVLRLGHTGNHTYSRICGLFLIKVHAYPQQRKNIGSTTTYLIMLSHLVEKPTMWFPNRSDTNRPVQLQKQARSLKFWSQVEEELYYPSSENKCADQLRGYREAYLRLCFRLCRLLVFPWGGSCSYMTSLEQYQ